MNFSAWSIRNPIPPVVLFIVLVVYGLYAFQRTKVQQMMDIDLPYISVAATLPGASPGQMESDVARKIESSIATLQGIKHIYTKVQDSAVTIGVEFRLEKPVQEALDEVRDAVSRVRADLPGELRDPVITKVNTAGEPVITFAVAAERADRAVDEESLSWFVDNTVIKTLLGVPGVGEVIRVGGVTREIHVELDPARLLALNATAGEVSRQLRQIQQEASGGRVDIGGIEQSVRTIATVRSAAEIGNMEIPLGGKRRVRLDELAQVTDTIAEQRAAALLDGRPVIGFEVKRARGASEIEVANGVRAVLKKLDDANRDIIFKEIQTTAGEVAEDFESSMRLLIEGALLAVVVVWLFLREGRSTLIAAAALPLSIIPTFGAMYLLGFTLNGVTLLAISLVVGILVDDAIVEIENIARHLEMGKTPWQAAMEAADEIGLAVIATTFTLIAVFLPTAFMGGVPGKFFVQFGWTAAIAVFVSLVVARLLTPMMAAYILRPSRGGHARPFWMKTYLAMAAWCLRHRLLTTLITLGFFFGSLVLGGQLNKSFMDANDISKTYVKLTLAPGSTFPESNRLAEQARRIIAANPLVKQIFTVIGGGAGDRSGGASARNVTLTIDLLAREERKGLSKTAIESQLREALTALPGVRVKVGGEDSGQTYGFVLSGENGDMLVEHARLVERELRTLPGVGAIISSASVVRPELVVRPDFARMADLGVTSSAIAEVLRIATTGDYEQSIAKLNLAQRQVPIVVRLPDAARQDLALLQRLTVAGNRGPVMIGNVATAEFSSGPTEFDRYDRQRNINFDIELNQQRLSDIDARVHALPSLSNLPHGITMKTRGDAESMNELFQSFGLAMLTGVLCIYVVLVLLFKDFVQPLTILAALVLSVPGAFLALHVTHSSLSLASLIGLLMLMGIATKNSILLVDYIVLARKDTGMERSEAILEACSKRARPIIMTTLAMGAGMMPIALGFGSDASFRSPMAIVVIGGLVTSTFLSLLVIPVVFTYLDDALLRLRQVLARTGDEVPCSR